MGQLTHVFLHNRFFEAVNRFFDHSHVVRRKILRRMVGSRRQTADSGPISSKIIRIKKNLAGALLAAYVDGLQVSQSVSQSVSQGPFKRDIHIRFYTFLYVFT